MACFLVPTTEAIIVTIVTKALKAKEAEGTALNVNATNSNTELGNKIPFAHKLKWLTNLLWGGSALLAFEHLWHGEVVPWFPFLTAASNPADASVMLHEMSTVGVSMALFVTAVWVIMVVVSSAMEKRALQTPGAQPAAN